MSKSLIGLALAVTLSMCSAAVGQANDPHHPPEAPDPATATAPRASAGSPPAASTPAGSVAQPSMMGMDKMMPTMMGQMMRMMMSGGQPQGDSGPSSQAFNGMMQKMHGAMQMPFTGNADVDFMSSMIPHHQGAIDMAKVALAFSKDVDVRRLAEKIIKNQDSEIAEIRDWLKKHGH